MSYGFPDWMFAAIAIAAYEIAAWFKHRFHLDWAMWAAYGVIAICAIVLIIRYIVRRIRRRHDNDADGPEDWRNY
ncbi:hypothetical protein [Alicyclobacillus fastidiosus]|uniref:Uncharacterized protein n=1 Tax=Alicyclobacillus fastidiosus TaxID=392011 RepID=A0ABV5AGT4_9BACL|nr:hypothetical protein [Alicyclobacillus fastidiosus]WEH11626.1 hypothetical protein PYS47_10665 [Alicyclobacillus fastidiosus]